MFDDEDGVAEVAQLFHDVDELGGVAGVQADGGFIEHVQRTDEAGTERGGELNALRFATGQGAGETVECEVVQADLMEEAGAFPDLLKNLAGNLHLRGRKVEGIEELRRGGDCEGRNLGDVFAADEDSASLGAQAGAAAIGAECVAAVL